MFVASPGRQRQQQGRRRTRSKKMQVPIIRSSLVEDSSHLPRSFDAKYGVQEQDGAATRSGTLPPRFTEPTYRQHYLYHTPPTDSSSHPPTMATNSEVTTPGDRTTSTAKPRGGVRTLSSPHKNAIWLESYAPVRTSDNLIWQKRPRTSPYPYARHHADAPNTRHASPESRPMTQALAATFPGRTGTKDINLRGGGGSLWGPTGVSPTSVANPSKYGMLLETEWACPSSSGATSTPSLHDGFSDVFATPTPGGSRRAALQPYPGRFRVVPARLSRSAEGVIRPRSGVRNYSMGNLGNWPLNTTERWMRAAVTEDNSQERLNKLRELRLRRLAERERKKEAWAPDADSSSDSDDADACEEPETDEEEGQGGEEETKEEKEKRRKRIKALRKKARRAKKRDAEWKSRNNRGNWQTAGRHGGIVARTKASMPALATRGNLVQLKDHADRVLIGKLARCWAIVADFFGVKHARDTREVPQPPDGDDRDLSGDAADFWQLMAGPEVQLTLEEVGVVQRRLDENAAECREGSGRIAGGAAGGRAVVDDGDHTVDRGWREVDDNTESAASVVTDSTRIAYGEVHGALFRSEDLEALAAAFQREGEMRKKEERRIALKRQEFEESMAKRRSGAIAEVVNAYTAGLGYRPSTKRPKKCAIFQAAPDASDGRSGGGGDDDDNGDDASEATSGTAATPASAAVSAASSSSSSSSRPNPATDWWTDGGVSNRWAMGPSVRKKLFLSLQAGTLAHMSLKQRRAAEKPWVKGTTHIHLRRPKEALVACAKYGRDFYRLTAAQVVLALRAYAAQRIQAQWRGCRPRRLFAPKILALRKLVQRERAIRAARRRVAFGGWKTGHRNSMELMRGTRRAFYRWRVESARLARMSELLRGTFWPLYVWRRWTNYRASSRDKAKFLQKVYLTAVTLRHFRAWNTVTTTGHRRTVRADRASSTRVKAKADRLFRYWAFARAACARRSDAHFRSYYLLGEMDRRRALLEKRGDQQQGRRGTKGASKRKWHKNGGHHSKRNTRGASGSLNTYNEGDDDDDENTGSRDHHPAAGDANHTARDATAAGERAAGDEATDSQKVERNGSTVGRLPRAEDNRIVEFRGGNSGYPRSPSTSHCVSASSAGGSVGSRFATAAGVTAAAGVINPPIAVLGRPNHVAFPGLEDTHFGDGVAEGAVTYACGVLRDHFEQKEVLKARVNFLLYQRLAPQVLVRLKIKANERQRSRYAAYIDARRVQKKHLTAWYFTAVQTTAVRRGITGEAMGMAINSVRATIQRDYPSRSSQDNGSLVTMGPSGPVASVGVTALTKPEGVEGAAAARTIGQSINGILGDSGVGGGDVGGGDGQEFGVNQLEEDRKIRRRQVERTAHRLSRLVGRTDSLKEQSRLDEDNTSAWASARKARERAVATFLKREGGKARSADEKAKAFVAGFKHHAAGNLVDVVARVFNAVVHGRRSIILRNTLRQWRSWYMLRVSVQLYNRQRLRDWLRICARLRYLWRGMPLFRELRVKWSVFHRLLELTDHRMRFGTPDMHAILRRRRELLLDFSRLLEERGFVPGRYCPEALLPATLDPPALIQRWKQYTQARAAARFLRDTLRRRHRHRVARVAFDGWRTGLGPRQRREAAAMKAALSQANGVAPAKGVGSARPAAREAVEETLECFEEEQDEQDDDSGEDSAAGGMKARTHRPGAGHPRGRGRRKVAFVEARADADLKVARRTVIAGWRSTLTRAIGLRNAKQEFRLKKEARQQPTFKKFVAFHTWQATERVRTESRLLVDAFLNRGRLKFRDQEPPDMVGRSNERGSGSGLVFFRDKPVPGSYLVCEVRVMTRVGEGVVGVQLVMTGGKRTFELPVHGAAAGENRSTRAHSFSVDAPVERLSRFECEHNDGLIERVRVVTSGGRWSPWFGERLTGCPNPAALPDWHHHSLAATTAAAAIAAKQAAVAAALASLQEVSSAEKAAAAAAAADADAAAATAPAWDIQKEYVTGLVGVRTQERLVGLGVITRHVTRSHVFSYLWEAPDEEEGSANKKSLEDSSTKGSIGEQRCSDTSLASGGSTIAGGDVDRGGSSIATSSRSIPPSPGEAAAGSKGLGGIGDGSGSISTSSAGSTLSRAEAKQQKFAQEMRDREREREELARLAREKEEELERLMRGGKFREEDKGDSGDDAASLDPSGMGVAGGRGKRARAPPAPQVEFASMLRMRQTDARLALERSMALARSARTYSGNSANNFDDANGALSTLTAVAGLTSWLHAALLPQLVPLPVLAATTTDMFHRGEKMLMVARATKDSGNRVKNAAERMSTARKERGRRGVMSPTQRAKEIRDRENLVEWETKSLALLEKARRQREEGERLLDDARDRLPKVSQSVKTIRMYLEYLKLARRQIELEREFGLGALRTRPAEGGGGGGTHDRGDGGGRDNGVLSLPGGCGIEESAFDATIKSLLHERQDSDLQTGGSGNGGFHEEQCDGLDGPSLALAGEAGSIEAENSALGTLVSSVNPWF